MKKAFFAFFIITVVIMLFAGNVPVVAQIFQVDPLDGAIREASTYLNSKIPKGSKAVFLNITSKYPDLSEYILSLLSENAVNDKNFSVVDREQLDSIRAELSFQMSGDVDDNSAQSIGKMLGAQSIVSGSVAKIGSLYRLQVKAIEVQTAEVKGQWSKNFPGGSPTIAALTQTQNSSETATTPSGGTAEAETPTGVAVTYKVGDKGPAGGWIFYDKGSYTGGWRYLEAMEYDFGTAQWGGRMENVTGTDGAIGTGKKSTPLIVDFLNRKNIKGSAAHSCNTWEYGGLSDWFLPSKDELNLMYRNLKLKQLGDFADAWYWSSTQTDVHPYAAAWAQDFSNGKQNGSAGYFEAGDKDKAHHVRACRQF